MSRPDAMQRAPGPRTIDSVVRADSTHSAERDETPSEALARLLDEAEHHRLRSLPFDDAPALGDGVLAYFGWPRAHEDEAERAVRAALRMQETVTRCDDDIRTG